MDLKTVVVHSKSKPAWNVVNKKLGGKYKIAIVPYVLTNDDQVTEQEKKEAFRYAEYISEALNRL